MNPWICDIIVTIHFEVSKTFMKPVLTQYHAVNTTMNARINTNNSVPSSQMAYLLKCKLRTQFTFQMYVIVNWTNSNLFFGHLGAVQQAVNTILTQYYLIKWKGKCAGREWLIYTLSRHGATLAFIWSCVSVHLVNLSPILTLL